MKKNGILTLLFAFIPGAGQMYQGYMKRGLSLVLMAVAIGMAAVLIPPVAFALLVVFMYSFFDTFNLRAQISMGTAPEETDFQEYQPEKRMPSLLDHFARKAEPDTTGEVTLDPEDEDDGREEE